MSDPTEKLLDDLVQAIAPILDNSDPVCTIEALVVITATTIANTFSIRSQAALDFTIEFNSAVAALARKYAKGKENE